MVGQQLDVAVGDVGKRLRRGPGIGAGHVCDTVMNDSVYCVGRVTMGSWPRRFAAPPLIYGHIYDDRTGLHKL